MDGTLASGDRTLSSGEYAGDHAFEARAGEVIVIDLRSTEFDPYLLVRSPGGTASDNDDFEGSSEHSRLELTLKENGTDRVQVTTCQKGETGAYVLQLPPQSRDAGSSARVVTERGRLEAGDRTLRTGEYKDDYLFEGRAGERAVLDLRSTEFDPYPILRLPDGEQQENVDHDGNSSWSQIAATLPAGGEYAVSATTDKAGALLPLPGEGPGGRFRELEPQPRLSEARGGSGELVPYDVVFRRNR